MLNMNFKETMKVRIITNRYRRRNDYTLKIMSGYRANEAIENCRFQTKEQALSWCQTIGYEVVE